MRASVCVCVCVTVCVTVPVGQFVHVIRKRIKLTPEKAIFIFVNNVLPPNPALMSTIYEVGLSPSPSLSSFFLSSLSVYTLCAFVREGAPLSRWHPRPIRRSGAPAARLGAHSALFRAEGRV